MARRPSLSQAGIGTDMLCNCGLSGSVHVNDAPCMDDLSEVFACAAISLTVSLIIRWPALS